MHRKITPHIPASFTDRIHATGKGGPTAASASQGPSQALIHSILAYSRSFKVLKTNAAGSVSVYLN